MMLSAHKTCEYWPLILTIAITVVGLSLLISLATGAVHLDITDVFSVFFSKQSDIAQTIVLEIRLPRAILAALVGAILALCGTVTQGLFRNPLADPSIIGVSAGASVGASVAIVLFSHQTSHIAGLSFIAFCAFIGSAIAVTFVYRLASDENGTSVTTMLLAGIALTFFAGSLSSFLEFIASNDMLRRLSLWRMGSFESANYFHVFIVGCVLAALMYVVPRYAIALNAFLLGESEARHLGFDINKVKTVLILCVAAGVGVSVAMAGTIAFIGLVVPHLVRAVIGINHRFVLPLSACVGATLLVVADVLARVVLSPEELPVGLVTSAIGAPLFIVLLKRRFKSGQMS